MPEGLRERKRRQTFERLERVAVEIALAEGVSAVTVERVSEAVMVSRSTFFNYFDSLDHAIFGAPLEWDPERTQHVLDQHADDLVLGVIRLVLETLRGPANSPVLWGRVALYLRELGVSRPVSAARAESRRRLVEGVQGWIVQRRNHGLPAADARPGEGEMVVSLALAVGQRLTWKPGAETDPDLDLDLGEYAEVRARLAAILAGKGSAAGRSDPAGGN